MSKVRYSYVESTGGGSPRGSKVCLVIMGVLFCLMVLGMLAGSFLDRSTRERVHRLHEMVDSLCVVTDSLDARLDVVDSEMLDFFD